MTRILCVDDDEAILKVVQTVLTKSGYEVTTQRNPKNVVAMAQEQTFDLFIVDVTMPEMDGHELCAQLKQNERTKTTPFIFLTGKNEVSDIVKGLEGGAQMYLAKPFNATVLVDNVNRLLEAAPPV